MHIWGCIFRVQKHRKFAIFHFADSFRIRGFVLQYMTIRSSVFSTPLMIDSTDFDALVIKNSAFNAKLTKVKDFKFIKNTFTESISFLNCWMDVVNADHTRFPGDANFAGCKLMDISLKGAVLRRNSYVV